MYLMHVYIYPFRKRIAIAIKVVKEASRAIVDVKSVVFFPIFVMAIGVAYGAFWIFGALYVRLVFFLNRNVCVGGGGGGCDMHCLIPDLGLYLLFSAP